VAHRATLYSIHVHERYKPKEPKELGQLDEDGAYLAEFLESVLDSDFSAENEDGNKDVTCSGATLSEPDLRVIFNPGERGIRADIADENGQLRFEQTARHTQILKSASLFRLPRNEKRGWWVLHLNHNRGIKFLVESELMKQFKEKFPDLILNIVPAINSEAYVAALERDDLLSATLYKYDRPSDISEGNKWVRSDTGLKMKLSIEPERGKRLLPELAKRAIRGDREAFGAIVEFGDVTFDQAKFEVELENGTRRTFNVQAPESGHAFSEDIEPVLTDDGEPTDDSLFSELERVLADLA
jgi:hypothetical protein